MEKIEAKQNFRYIDYFKALLMLLVIWGHINFANQSIKPWIYALHMPAFFFASGMLVKNQSFQGISDCWMASWRKFVALMFPYFIWALIYTSLSDSNLVKILYGSQKSLVSANTLSSLWFLPVLFDATFFLFTVQWIVKEGLKLPVKLILCIISFGIAAFLPHLKHGYPWCLDVSFMAFGFMLLGNILFPLIQSLQKKVNLSNKATIICFMVAILSFAGSFIYQLNNPEFGIALMAEARYGNVLLFILAAFSGTAFVLSLGMLLDRALPKDFSPKWDVISFFGKNTLCAMVVHKLFIYPFMKVFKRVQVPDAVALIITCCGCIVGSCLMALFMNRFFPEMVGKAVVNKRDVK